ncbi:MAG: lysophospholipase [Planctomycetes bacterium]|nr:lysophospholipase [Planctomycetota bacterium]MCB9891741.1 lysophospholipase [Planctomycetota bacterium]
MPNVSRPIEGTFRDDTRRIHRSWTLPGVRAQVFLVHGMGEHGGRYESFAERLQRMGCAVHLMDLRGHGGSAGRVLHVERFAQYVLDLEDFVHERGNTPSLPTFLIGHSLGSIIAGHYVLRHPSSVQGLALLASPIGSPRVVPFAKRVFGPPIARLFPTLRVAPTYGPEVLSSDPAVGAAFRQDPLCRDRCTLRFGAETLRAIRAFDRHAADLRVPTLVMHGAADLIAPVAGVRSFFERLGAPDKTLHVFEGAMHELHHEVESLRERFYFHLQEWLERLV